MKMKTHKELAEGWSAWQYTGIVPFDELVHWCCENIQVRDWFWSYETLYFRQEKDYVFFLLRWA